MGSLMAGWASPVQDERKVQARRNRSLTKEEIEAFRRSQKKGEDEDFEVQPTSPTFGSPNKSQLVSSEAIAMKKPSALLNQLEKTRPPSTQLSRPLRTVKLPETPRAACSGPSSPHAQSAESPRGEQEQETIGSKPDKTGDWWTRSNWAFLNEPPRDELAPSAHNYTAQFDVANLTTAKKLVA
ncbi:uncharacterized protein LOC109705819 isoform X1 [Ananas comosus]|uniref:Uncharacterized protein LOC109705819 isoform X1 n=1 Tax=Ananas comosus TaxID=4615 RepID=A0A6P5EFI1_ANACO|nr:uncharacterized protein LOC109705819 isoform X1 [Ananas comosus]